MQRKIIVVILTIFLSTLAISATGCDTPTAEGSSQSVEQQRNKDKKVKQDNHGPKNQQKVVDYSIYG
jgi:hypothetical protein